MTADPSINVVRVKLRAFSGGHDVPEEKIVSRYHKALMLVPELLEVCDICHIYDNTEKPYRIFKKRKDELFYDENNDLWNYDKILELTHGSNMKKQDLNITQ